MTGNTAESKNSVVEGSPARAEMSDDWEEGNLADVANTDGSVGSGDGLSKYDSSTLLIREVAANNQRLDSLLTQISALTQAVATSPNPRQASVADSTAQTIQPCIPEELIAEIELIRGELKQARQNCIEQADQNDDFKSQIESLTQQNDTLSQQNQELQRSIGDLSLENEQVADPDPELQRENESLTNRIDSLSETNQSLTLQAELLFEREDDLQKQIDTLIEQNRSLTTELSQLSSAEAPSLAAAAIDSSMADSREESLTWEQRKEKILQQMENETFDADSFVQNLQSESASDEDPASIVNRLFDSLQRMETQSGEQRSEIQQLQRMLDEATQTAAASGGDTMVGAAAIAGLLDSDELVREERERWQSMQQHWQEKFRDLEVKSSVERAKLSRERQTLASKVQEMEDELSQLRRNKACEEENGPGTRKWLVKLGLNDT